MVETVHIRPRSGVVAGFTAERGSIRPASRHPVAKLPMMRILVAGRARFVCKMERQDLVRTMGESLLVTFIAWHGSMRSV